MALSTFQLRPSISGIMKKDIKLPNMVLKSGESTRFDKATFDGSRIRIVETNQYVLAATEVELTPEAQRELTRQAKAVRETGAFYEPEQVRAESRYKPSY